jgi:hypothetical protein
MPVADKIAALFEAMTQKELDAMAPVVRRRFADTLRHWADRAEIGRRVEPPPAGILNALALWRGHE